MPAGDELRKVAEGFKTELGFQQCAGVVDGTCIQVSVFASLSFRC